MRGIGELEQYQGAPNPSVGFLIDDIDFSGVGAPATTFDVKQVEVLRGPQGTRYGANALAGLISVRTMDPTVDPEFSTEVTAGGDGLIGGGVVAGGALGSWGKASDSAWRVAAQRTLSDGFRHNAYLDRDDTNDRDETTLRGKLTIGVTDDWRVDATALYAAIHNGFDAFSLDNSFRTLSNQPGRDEQRSEGAMLRVTGDLGPVTLVEHQYLRELGHRLQFRRRLGERPVLGRLRSVRLFLALRPTARHARRRPPAYEPRRCAIRRFRLARRGLRAAPGRGQPAARLLRVGHSRARR